MKKIAIIKYHGATDTKGARVSVNFGFFKAIISYDYECNHTYEMVIKHAEEINRQFIKSEKKKGFSYDREGIAFGEPVYINASDVYGIEYMINYQ